MKNKKTSKCIKKCLVVLLFFQSLWIPPLYSFAQIAGFLASMEACSGILIGMISEYAAKSYDRYHANNLQQVVGSSLYCVCIINPSQDNRPIGEIMAAYAPSQMPNLSQNMIGLSLELKSSAHNYSNTASQDAIKKALQPVDMSLVNLNRYKQERQQAAKIKPIAEIVRAQTAAFVSAELKIVQEKAVVAHQQAFLNSVDQAYRQETQFAATCTADKVTYIHPSGVFASVQVRNQAPSSVQANSERNIQEFAGMALSSEYKALVDQSWTNHLNAILRCDTDNTKEALRAYLNLPHLNSNFVYGAHLAQARDSLIERFFDREGRFQAVALAAPANEIRYYGKEFVKNSLDSASPAREAILNNPALQLHKDVSWLQKKSHMSGDLLKRIELNPTNIIYKKMLAYGDKFDMQSLEAMKKQFPADPVIQRVVAQYQAEFQKLMYQDGFIKACLNDPIFTNLSAAQKAVLNGSPARMREFNNELLVRSHIKSNLQKHWGIPDGAPNVVHDALYKIMGTDGVALTDVRLLIDKVCEVSNNDAMVRKAFFMSNGVMVGFKEYPCVKNLAMPYSILNAEHGQARQMLNHLVHQMHMFPNTPRARHATHALSYLQESFKTPDVSLQKQYAKLAGVTYDAICTNDQTILNSIELNGQLVEQASQRPHNNKHQPVPHQPTPSVPQPPEHDKDKEKKLVWINHNNKHVPCKSQSWKDIIKETKHGDAKYKHDVDIRSVEEFVWKNGRQINNEKSQKLMKFDKIIGAYEGEETNCVIVKMSANTIHGHPISLEKFIKYTR